MVQEEMNPKWKPLIDEILPVGHTLMRNHAYRNYVRRSMGHYYHHRIEITGPEESVAAFSKKYKWGSGGHYQIIFPEVEGMDDWDDITDWVRDWDPLSDSVVAFLSRRNTDGGPHRVARRLSMDNPDVFVHHIGVYEPEWWNGFSCKERVLSGGDVIREEDLEFGGDGETRAWQFLHDTDHDFEKKCPIYYPDKDHAGAASFEETCAALDRFTMFTPGHAH